MPKVTNNVTFVRLSIPLRTQPRESVSGGIIEDYIDKCNLRPTYNRPLSWNMSLIQEFVRSVMCGQIIPPVILYKHPDGEGDGNKETECIDGQHRLTMLKHFVRSEQVVVKYKKVMVTIYDKQTKTHMFYTDSPHVSEWADLHPNNNYTFMSDEQKQQFNKYKFEITLIHGGMTIDERRKMFLSLSGGKMVVNSDQLKNCTNFPLVRLISDTLALEAPITNMIHDKCTKKSNKYWLHWTIRLFLLMKSPTLETFMTTDKKINGWLKQTDCVHFDTTEEEERRFEECISKFISFMDKKISVPVSPCHLFALFVQLNKNCVDEDILASHVPSFVDKKWKSYNGINVLTAWETPPPLFVATPNDYIKMREKAYIEVIEHMSSISCKYEYPAQSKNKKATRDDVWLMSNTMKKDEHGRVVGKCYCCKQTLYMDEFERGHIKSKFRRGDADEYNMRPIHRTCNLEMGITHMHEWMDQKGYEIVEGIL
jgi:hypothetical protein